MCSCLPSHPLHTLGVAFSYHRMSSIHSQHSRRRSLCKWSPLPHFPLASPPTAAWLLHPSPTETALLKAKSAPFGIICFSVALTPALLSTYHHCPLSPENIFPGFCAQRAPRCLLIPQTLPSLPRACSLALGSPPGQLSLCALFQICVPSLSLSSEPKSGMSPAG